MKYPACLVRLAAGLTGFTLATFATAAGSNTPPNIIVVLVDDMGVSDIGCYGSEIPTPNIDALAANGVRFSQFYNTSRCCPSRASLLTGLYPHQAGVGYMMRDQGPDHPGYRGQITDRAVTIPEVLHSAGYFTAMAGKWHLGQPHGCVPWERGFDRSLNAPAGGFYFSNDPKVALFLNGKKIKADDPELSPPWYTTDLWTSFGLRFIDEAIQAKQPFFLYLAHNAPHFPLQATAEDIAPWRGKFKAGWDRLREQRYERQKQLGFIKAEWPLSPRPDSVPAWDSLSAQDQDRFDHLMAIYAAVMTRLDHAVGNLVAGLKQRGVLENTVIVFMSDNGGNAESGPNGRMIGDNPGAMNSTVFYGQNWATLSNTPFRRYKHFTNEGGIAAPLIVSWPAGIPAALRNTWNDTPGHEIDLMTTFADLAGAHYPAEFKGKPILPAQGVSLRPALVGQKVTRAQPIFWEHEGNRAVRDGRWKLVSKLTEPWELYDLEADRTEGNDVAAKEPARVAAMTAAYEKWAKESLVEPWPGGPRDDAGRPINPGEEKMENGG
jgi:arylsulfatase A-like enzyme